MRRDLGPDVLFNTVMMMRMRSRKTVLLTESEIDARFYQKFVSENYCFVGHASTRPRVIEMLERFTQNHVQACVGIVDADDNYVLKRPKPNPAVYFTEKSDKETTIIDSPAFDDFCSVMGATVTAAEIRNKVYEAATPLGAIRRLSARDGLGLDFKRIVIGNFVSLLPACNLQGCCAEVRAMNPDIYTTDEALMEFVREAEWLGIPKPYLLRGHDLIAILELSSQSLFGRTISQRDLEDELAKAFRTDHFQSTTTYAELREWEKTVLPTYRLFP